MTENTNNKIEFTPARREAIDRAAKKHGAMINKFFLGSIKKHDIAQDLSQIFWVQVYSTFREQDFFEKGFLLNKARQVLSNYLRYCGVRAFVEFNSESKALESAPAVNPYLDDVEAERKYWEEEAPEVDLTETERRIFWLRVRHSTPFPELAEQFQTPVSTIQDRYNRIVAKIREACNKERNG